MASLASTAPTRPRPQPPAEPGLPPAGPRRRTAGAHRLIVNRWPHRWPARLVLRALLAAPFAVLAVRAYHHHFSDDANRALVAHAGLIHWGSDSLSFVAHAYPPLPTALAALLPWPTALGVLGAVGAGTMLEVVGARLSSRGYPLWAVLLLVATLGASPSFALTATSDLGAFLALTLLALALDGFVQFALRGYTHAGFRAGIAVGLAALCDPVAVVCAVGFAVAAPLIAAHRYRHEHAARRATAAVLLFPTVAGLGGWTFLCWRFASRPLAWLRASAPHVWDRHGVGAALHQSALPVLLTPVFALAVLLLLARRQPAAALGIGVPLLAVLVAILLGLNCPPAFVAVVLGIVGLASLPRRPRGAVLALITVVALAGLTAKWAYPASPRLAAWEHAVTAGG